MNDHGGAEQGTNDSTSYHLSPPAAGSPYAGIPPAGVPPQADPGAHRLVAGRYRLLDKLGHGGMGTVWRARDETVDREVAVKEPRVPEHLPQRERDTVFERMRREARAAARLAHPAVVSVHDIAVEDGRPWIVMEFVRGRSLGAVLQEGTLGAREAARIGLQVLGALEAAHAAGVLHRDVKPDNVMLGRYDRVVLTDFGIARIEGDTKLTDTGGFIGSPEFVAPERVLGQQPGPASDLWSLGVVLYAATEGVSPFRRTNTAATLQAVLNASPSAPTSASGPLAEAIEGLLRKDPAHRPSAARVRELLERSAQPPPPPRVAPAGTGAEVGGVRRGRRALVGAGAVVLAAAAAAGYLIVADPFAGSLPDGWTTHREAAPLAATLAVPDGYLRIPDEDDTSVVTYEDPSGAIVVRLARQDHVADQNSISGTADAQAFKDSDALRSGRFFDSHLSMSSDTETVSTTDATVEYQGRDAALNTITYGVRGSALGLDGDVPREAKAFYYRTRAGDMYRLWIDYPGKGDVTDRGRRVAEVAVAHLDVGKP